jgi:hypothetical protein
MTALATAKEIKGELGGVISIGGRIPSSCMLINGPKKATPVLLLGGSKGSVASGDAVKSTKGTFERVEHHQWKKADDGMPKNREEAWPMMQFFARRLRSQNGVPEGERGAQLSIPQQIRESINSLQR